MADDNRSRLGRGLAALMGDVGAETRSMEGARSARRVPIEYLKPSPRNPRRSFAEEELDGLAASIKERGIIQPVVVRAIGEAKDRYEIIAGERRWRAAQRAGLHEIPIVPLEATDSQALELAFLLGPLTAPTISNRVLCDYSVGFLASPSLGLGKSRLTVHDLAKFPIITFPRKTPPYEIVRSLFNRPDLPPIRLHASASLGTVIHMATEGLGIAVIPTAIVESEMADGRLRLLSTDLRIAPLTFSASWLASPDTVAIERVAELAGQLAQAERVDAPRRARH